MKTVRKILFLPLLCLAVLFACREIELVVPTEYELLPGVPIDPDARPAGMYLLNEANMGSNKSSIDYVDFRNAYYVRNIYAERNPEVVKELGDVGNDIQIYGNKLYAVINCSHKVEVMDVRTCKRIGQVDIPNCRYIRFAKGKAYVSAYVGPVAIDPNAQLGAVYEVDTASLAVTRKVTVGYQPDELEVLGEYLYVANSGGYRAPDYDSTVSVVEIYGMKQIQKIPVGINLHRIRKDRYGKLWVTSRGDYNTIPAPLRARPQGQELQGDGGEGHVGHPLLGDVYTGRFALLLQRGVEQTDGTQHRHLRHHRRADGPTRHRPFHHGRDGTGHRHPIRHLRAPHDGGHLRDGCQELRIERSTSLLRPPREEEMERTYGGHPRTHGILRPAIKTELEHETHI